MVRKTGFYEVLGSLKHFIPYPLPPKSPVLELSGPLVHSYGKAMWGIGQLNEMVGRLPNIHRFIKAALPKKS